MDEDLAAQHCVPCGRGETALPGDAVDRLIQALPQWTLGEDGRALQRNYAFGDFGAAFAFVSRVAAIAEAERHHPDLGLGWGYVTVRLQTHAIDGLHRNDFVLAARIEQAFKQGRSAGPSPA